LLAWRPVAGLAAKVMVWTHFARIGNYERTSSQTSVYQGKRISFSASLPEWISSWGPEMRSTGEVMGIARDFPIAFAKSQLSAGVVLPTSGNVFLSLNSRHKHRIASIATRLHQLGFTVLATPGTASEIEKSGIPVSVVKKIAEGSPNLIDDLKNEEVSLIINTPNGKGARTDEGRIRAAAVQHGIPCITTIAAANAAIMAMEALREEQYSVECLQVRFS
jgi:carbamoyl-phosphate synthase large subunit